MPHAPITPDQLPASVPGIVTAQSAGRGETASPARLPRRQVAAAGPRCTGHWARDGPRPVLPQATYRF